MRPRPIAEKGRLVAAAGKAVWPLFARGQVKPVIDSTFPLAEAARAHARMEEGEHIGKVLLAQRSAKDVLDEWAAFLTKEQQAYLAKKK